MAAQLIYTPESIPSLSLSPQDVHVWTCDLTQLESERVALAALLGPDEQHRAARFAFEEHRRRFIVSHGLLRVILAQYVKQEPSVIQFDAGLYGKPSLRCQSDAALPIEFSLSHSGHYAAVAVGKGRAVGVDVEVRRPDVQALKLAQRFFAPAESERMAQAREEEQQRMFYRYWTGKEAYLKGRGIGLSLGLDRFELLFDEGLTQAQVRSTESGSLDRDWSVHSLEIDKQVAGAIAVGGEVCRIQMFTATILFH